MEGISPTEVKPVLGVTKVLPLSFLQFIGPVLKGSGLKGKELSLDSPCFERPGVGLAGHCYNRATGRAATGMTRGAHMGRGGRREGTSKLVIIQFGKLT